MKLHKRLSKLNLLSFAILMLLISVSITAKNLYVIFVLTITIFILILYQAKTNTLISGILNIGILLYMPLFITQNHQALFLKKQSSMLFMTLIAVLVLTIIHFFILSTFVNQRNINQFLVFYLFNVFIIYISLIYSTISCFAILYSNLSTIFNEGIISGTPITKNIDALYFSTTTFFTIGLGDIYPTTYSTLTKTLVISEAVISHLITVILWPVCTIIIFNRFEKNNL